MPGVDDYFFTTTHPSLSGLKRLPSHRIFYGTAGERVWLRAGLAVRPVHVSLLAAGLNPKHCGTPGHTVRRRAHRADDIRGFNV